MRSFVPLALVALLAAGCGSSNEPERGAPASTPPSTPPSTPASDPATVAGACAILVRDGLVDEALSVARDPGKAGSRPVSEVQNDLFAIVAAGTTSLVDPTGQLVDLLDDPAAYREGTGFTSSIDRAVADIRKTCAQD